MTVDGSAVWTGDSVLLLGGSVIDGTGAPARRADALVIGGKFTEVGPRLQAVSDIPQVDITGSVLIPGFVDVHTHDDLAVLARGGCASKVRQGVTTSVLGNCGQGCAPSTADGGVERLASPVLGGARMTHSWPRFSDYLDELGGSSRDVNTRCLVAHASVRAAVMGVTARVATTTERGEIAALLDSAMSAGAVGLSLGLLYSPGSAADQDELLDLARVVSRHDGVLAAHIRNEADQLIPSIEEIVDLARGTGVAIQISHLKVTKSQNFGSMPEVIRRLDRLRDDGIDVMADVYPYEAGSTTTSTMLPPWATREGGDSIQRAVSNPALRNKLIGDLSRPWDPRGPENYLLSTGPGGILLAGFARSENLPFEGQSLREIAQVRGAEPVECFVDLLAEEGGALSVILFHTDPGGVEAVLSWPHALIGSDGLPSEDGYVHPRLYGTFPRVLSRYSGPGALLTREEAIRRMTGASAARFRLADRGTVTPGLAADFVIADLKEIRDEADFAHPRAAPTGIHAVAVNGRPAWTEGDASVRQHGRMLRHKGACAPQAH